MAPEDQPIVMVILNLYLLPEEGCNCVKYIFFLAEGISPLPMRQTMDTNSPELQTGGCTTSWMTLTALGIPKDWEYMLDAEI
ncbi:hypothetical protein ACLOJK_011816 [Asimina triloba]